MKKSEEPPSKFESKKEVSKNKNISELLTLLKNNKKKAVNIEKNLEKKVISTESKKISLNDDYIKTVPGYFDENISSLTKETVEFTKTIQNADSNLNINYLHNENLSISKKNPENFYKMNTSYSFTPLKEEKKEEFDSEKEKPKEIIYNLFCEEENLEEESVQNLI